MTGLRTFLAALAAAALGVETRLAVAEPATPTDRALVAGIWLRPGLGLLRPEAPALLTLPAGWMAGDAVVVLAPDAAPGTAARDRLVAALPQAGSGVLEISRHRAHALAADFAAALDAAEREIGAGIVAVVARADAAAALAAAEAAATPGGGRYAAGVALDPTAPRIRFAAASPAEDWPTRAPLFCALLASALPAARERLDAACREGMAPLR
jgi:hypothetical protein